MDINIHGTKYVSAAEMHLRQNLGLAAIFGNESADRILLDRIDNNKDILREQEISE